MLKVLIMLKPISRTVAINWFINQTEPLLVIAIATSKNGSVFKF